MESPLRLGVSACLLGHPVRYDGGHKHDRWITGELGKHVAFAPVCPEAEAGFGIPREAMRLVGDPADPRLVTIQTGRDMTPAMKEWAAKRLDELALQNLCGFIFKSRSPSSGMERVKVYPEKGGPAVNKGVGIFAAAFMKRFPLLPVEEDGRLNDARLRENFIERIFTLRRWRETARTIREGASARELIGFQARHKLLLMAHSPENARLMGKLVAAATRENLPGTLEQYETLLLKTTAVLATVRKHVNVLQHMAGYFKKLISPDERQELAEVIDEYRQGLTPLIVPLTLVNHHVRKHGVAYLAEQAYLRPHPVELKLRNYY
ncbi:YbgA family protein [Fundidesulfovibrio agrisoli]|uniref:YbgA family protein n=1 Tax=Fundidesulfovibrio agrisoli TaxID=2922717 RepID=UPI001FAE277D|nr:DUF523 and DUF1722 domain-containing protein [Fundidesulfovibrio agrisoli]